METWIVSSGFQGVILVIPSYFFLTTLNLKLFDFSIFLKQISHTRHAVICFNIYLCAHIISDSKYENKIWYNEERVWLYTWSRYNGIYYWHTYLCICYLGIIPFADWYSHKMIVDESSTLHNIFCLWKWLCRNLGFTWYLIICFERKLQQKNFYGVFGSNVIAKL